MKNWQIYYIICSIIFYGPINAQNSHSKWYFGNQAGLDFMTSPPTILTNGAMNSQANCIASVANSAGNLLFYSNGKTVWNSAHLIMNNGSGLISGNDNAFAVKQPGNPNIYYLFHPTSGSGVPILYYSIIDMNLAVGMGSVTVKNAIHSFSTTAGIAAVKHCNGQDIWIITREYYTNNFKAFLLTNAGLNTTPVVSSAGSSYNSVNGWIKISPTSRKLASDEVNNNAIVCDLDASTGIVSNPIYILGHQSWGIEFSPDGSKLYLDHVAYQNIIQYDLCISTQTAIAASAYTISSTGIGGMQLAPDGKIYVNRWNQQALGVINNPNLAGAACNYVDIGQTVAPKSCRAGLPIFVAGYHPTPPPFTVSVVSNISCNTATFSSPTPTAVGCASTGYSVTNMLWNFGDPSSGTFNTSTNFNPTHLYTAIGNYTATLIIYYTCGGGTDTLRQPVTILGPTLSVNSTSITCANLGSATVAPMGSPGPFSYTWLPSNQTSSVASGLIPGSYTISTFDASTNCLYISSVFFTPLIPLTGTISATNSFVCNGVNTGTGSVTNLAGGSGNQSYLWTNGSTSYTTAFTNSLSAGFWSVNVTDALTGCQINQSFFISQPPPLVLNLATSSPTACVNTNIVLTGTNSGGTPGYSYTWTSGPSVDTHTVTNALGGTYIYTLSSSDANNCLTSNTIAVDFINNPVLAVSDVSICPLAFGNLSVSGGSTYLWSNNTTGNSLSDNPLSDTQYTVVGSALGCSTAATASIILFPSPVPVLNSNSPVCNGQTLQLSASGGSNYLWNGPAGFNSALQVTAVNPAAPLNSGVYNLMVTSAQGCTASASSTLIVNPTPTLSASGSTVCTTQTLNLSASSLPGASFAWSGPLNFSSSLQNPFIINPAVNRSGTYTVKATSAVGCTNVATANVLVVPLPSLNVALSSPSLCYQAFNGSPNTITLSSTGANTYTLYTPYLINVLNPAGPSSTIASLPPYSTTMTIGTATLVGSNGVCSSFTTATFSVVPNPTIGINSYTPVICAGQNFTYTSFGADSYTWGPNSPNLTTYTSAATVASPSITSLYSVVGGSMGCNSPTQTSTITVYPLPTISLTPTSPTICLNEKVTLTANGTGTSFTWSPYQGLNDIVGQGVIASPSQTQSYSVTASANNCTSTAKVTVTVFPLPLPIITVKKSAVCLNDLVEIQGSGGVSYNWFGPLDRSYSGEKISFGAGSQQLAGTYTLTVTDLRGCKNSTKTAITVLNLPQGSLLGYKEEGCEPFCNQYNFSAENVTSSWQIGNQYFNNKFFYCFYNAGTYSIRGNLYDSTTTCANSYTFNVIVHPKPEADFIYEPLNPVENLDEVIYTNISRGEEQTKWNWFFNDNKGFTTDAKSTSYLYANEGQYPVVMTVSNKWNCADTIIRLIKVEPDFNIYVPNVFTPNGDDRNDVFYPVITGSKQYDLKIFNRWGAVVFHSTDVNHGWDGYYNSEECKQDVYQWKIQLLSTGGERKQFDGHVTLTR